MCLQAVQDIVLPSEPKVYLFVTWRDKPQSWYIQLKVTNYLIETFMII
jgi:hypothetical protein